MKKLLYLFLLILASYSLSAQRMEIIGGVNGTTFYDNAGDEGHFSSSYTSNTGYVIRLGVDDIKVGWWESRLTLSYDKYGGGLNASDGGLGGGYIMEAEVEKSLISLGLFPVNVKIINKIDLSMGMEFSALLDESFMGTYTNWNMGSPDQITDLQDKYDSYSAGFYVGLQGRIGYEIKLSDRLFVVPQYVFYFGLSKEFKEFPEQAKSMRHYLNIGL